MFMLYSSLITAIFYLAGRVLCHLLHHRSGRLIRRSYRRRFAGEHKMHDSLRKRQYKLRRIGSTSS